MLQKLLSIIAAICICIQPCCAIYDAEVDYMELMIECAAAGDWEMGQYAQFGRDAKIDAEGIDAKKISYEDLYSLLREKDISDEKDVRYGVIEPNGTLSVLTDESLSGDSVKSRDLKKELDDIEKEEST